MRLVEFHHFLDDNNALRIRFELEGGRVLKFVVQLDCAPVFVYLISFALKLERATPLKWAAIVTVMLGIVLLTRVYIEEGRVTLISVGAGLLSGLSYAVFIFGFKYASTHGILVVAFATLIPILMWMGNTDQIVGLNHTAPAVASIVAMIEPVTASLFGVMVLNESLAGPQIFGMGLILVTVTTLSVKSNSRLTSNDSLAE